MGMTLAPTIAPAGESAPSAQLPCPCALPEGSYDVTATNLAGMQCYSYCCCALCLHNHKSGCRPGVCGV